MKKSFALIFLLLAVVFAALTWLRHSGDAEEISSIGAEDVQRQRIRDFWAAYQEATTLRVAGKFEPAAGLYEKALAIDPAHEESLYYLGNCFFELGEYERALVLYEKLIELNPSSQRALSQLGVILSAPLPGVEPDWERAEAAFRKSIGVNREESGPFLRLGYLELQRNRLEAAFGHFQTAAGFRSPEGLFMAGFVRFRQKRFLEAADFFGKVLEIQTHENKISGRGVASEGDVETGGAALTPLQAAAIKSRAFLAWLPQSAGSQASEDFLRRVEAERGRIEVCRIRPGGRDWSELGRVAEADWDGDGDLDLAVADVDGGLLLLRRSGEALRPVEIAALGVGVRDVLWGDFDGDGAPDLYTVGSGLLGRGQNRLLRNDCPASGDCRFSDVTAEAGLSGVRNTIRALFLDYDGDGRMDLLEAGAGGTPLRVYRNLGNGRFKESSADAGLGVEGTVVDLAPGDFDGDGRGDFFVLRWGRPGLLFLNQGGGRFREASDEMGLDEVGGDALSGLAFDYDRDGRDDLLVASRASWERSLQFLLRPALTSLVATPRLFRNVDGKRFEDVTAKVGLDRGWGVIQALALDFDRDGWPDLLFANGGPEAYRFEPSVLLRNDGGRFVEHARLPAIDSPANVGGAAVLEWSDRQTFIQLAGVGCFR